MVFWLLLVVLLVLYQRTRLALLGVSTATSLRHVDVDGDGQPDADLAASIDDVGVPITLSWRDLSVTRDLGDGRVITTVRPTNGALRPGQLTAIMGGSGSGKSTLLRALMGRSDAAERRLGELSINGRVVRSEDMGDLAVLIGFVPQEDVMHDDLSVQENLQFSAEWRWVIR